MDNRRYISPTVAAWVEAHKVCPEGRDLAASCIDLQAVWHKIDRPAWLVWFYGMATVPGLDPMMAPADVLAALPDGDTMARWCIPKGVPDSTINNVELVNPTWCDFAREHIPCPFTSKPAVAPCSVAADAIEVPAPAAPATRPAGEAPAAPVEVRLEADKAGKVRGVSVSGRAFVPMDEAAAALDKRQIIINAQGAAIDELRDAEAFWHRMWKWTSYAVLFAMMGAMALCFLIRREDNEQ